MKALSRVADGLGLGLKPVILPFLGAKTQWKKAAMDDMRSFNRPYGTHEPSG
jgi:hypothetical protein